MESTIDLKIIVGQIYNGNFTNSSVKSARVAIKMKIKSGYFDKNS